VRGRYSDVLNRWVHGHRDGLEHGVEACQRAWATGVTCPGDLPPPMNREPTVVRWGAYHTRSSEGFRLPAQLVGWAVSWPLAYDAYSDETTCMTCAVSPADRRFRLAFFMLCAISACPGTT
jgi:hypothetical protein